MTSPPCSPAPGPMSTTQSATLDGVLVVLDDHHRVAQIAQAGERLDEALVVALVQTDRRLVEHVEHADQAGCRSATPGGCAAPHRRPAWRPTVEREVVEAHVEQEAHAGVDLLHHALGDEAVALVEFESGEELGRLTDRQVAHLGDVVVADRDRQRRRLEPGSLADGARHLTHVRLVAFAAPVGLGVGVAALQPRDDALVGRLVLAQAAVAVLVLDRDLALGAVEDEHRSASW